MIYWFFVFIFTLKFEKDLSKTSDIIHKIGKIAWYLSVLQTFADFSGVV
jgi:hypothetical protein